MGSRGGARSSALDRAMAHLSGQRISNTGVSKDKRDVVSVYGHSCSTEIKRTLFYVLNARLCVVFKCKDSLTLYKCQELL